jgi:hypothetical protein
MPNPHVLLTRANLALPNVGLLALKTLDRLVQGPMDINKARSKDWRLSPLLHHGFACLEGRTYMATDAGRHYHSLVKAKVNIQIDHHDYSVRGGLMKA